nr:hypothetical protein [Methanophagales archaeon]
MLREQQKRRRGARGYNTLLLTTHLEGESREVAKVFVAVARDIRRYGIPIKTPAAVIAGGETTVSVVGTGRGGRNQEFVLSAAIRIASEEGIVVASIGTDGIDGVSEAAGAIADGFTLEKGEGRLPRRRSVFEKQRLLHFLQHAKRRPAHRQDRHECE